MEGFGRLTVAFVCVKNAGRSQMAFAFAQEQVMARGLEAEIELVMGGSQPADHVHEGVVSAMQDVGVDISTRRPREVTFEETRQSDIVITMGCAAEDVCPAGWAGENREWDLEDPGGKSTTAIAHIRDDIDARVTELFDELEGTL